MLPNIVLITTDQQRRDSLGAYGNRYVHTPNLDSLASSATVYEHCYCDAPMCTPSRTCLLTGKTLMGHGVYNLFDILPVEEKLLPWYLREMGYATALVGKLHVSGTEKEAFERNPGDGFDIYEMTHEPSIYLDAPYNAYARWLEEHFPEEYAALQREGRKRRYRRAETHFTTWVSERSAQIVRERDRNKPLFLFASYFDPHNPYDHYPPESAELLNEEAYPEPIADDVTKMPEGLRWEVEYHSPKALNAGGLDDREIRRGYFAGVNFIDQKIGSLLQALKDEGIYDDTLIIFTSDHGDMLGDHGLHAKGAMFYEQCVNVPLIIKFPHQKTDCRSEDLVMLHDLFNTMFTAAGGDASMRWESLALQGAEKRDFAATEYRAIGKFDIDGFPHPLHATMIRTKEWKLNLYHDTCESQLFHLTEDPQELNNLHGLPEYAAKEMEMTQMYLRMNAERETRYNMSRGGLSPMPKYAYLHRKDKEEEK